MNLTHEDEELIDAASEIINRLYQSGRHHLGTALRTASGRVVTAVNVDAYVGRVGVCAEAIALGKMISEGENDFVAIATVYKPKPDAQEGTPYVVSPCGICREMLSDYNPKASVIFDQDDMISKATAAELLPGKYVKRNS